MFKRVSFEEESADFPVFAAKPNRPKQASQLADAMFLRISLNIRMLKCVSSERPPELRAGSDQKREETVLIHKMLVMLERRITMSHMKRANLVRSIVTQSWYKTFSFHCVQCHPTKKKDCAGDVEKFKRSCRQIRHQVSFIWAIPWSLFALHKTDVGITTSQPHTDQKPT